LPNDDNLQTTGPEKLLTFHATAAALGIPYYKVQRAGRAGFFPKYQLYNKRPLVKLSEVLAAIEATKTGGG
jgi:hypothetical protein